MAFEMDNPYDRPKRRRRREPRRTPLVVRALYMFVALLAVGTAVGLVLLWPRGELNVQQPESTPPAAHKAEIIRLEKVECVNPQSDSCQRASAEVQEGPNKGDTASFLFGEDTSQIRLGVGDHVRVFRNQIPEGGQIDGLSFEEYSLADYERRAPLLWLTIAFCAIVIIAGRMHGFRALVGLALSLGIVVAFILPAILDGRMPLAVALVGSLAVMLVTMALSHGFGPKTLAASIGTALSLLLIAGLAVLFSSLANLTGFSSEEALYLRATVGDLSLQGMLLAGIVIAALGVLDDVTISQASTVLQLRRANPAQSFTQLFRGGISVGQDHLTATVNTLVLAYVGASLPILLIFAVGNTPFADAINKEAVAEQIIATLAGSIGLIAAVPITTAIAALLAVRLTEQQLESVGEAHAHAH